MIPSFNASGVLPPFVGSDAAAAAVTSPYACSISEFVVQFANTADRREIASGLLAFREELRRLGIVDGQQWFDGSFVEDCEVLRGRPPSDLDLVTVAKRPSAIAAEWEKLIRDNPAIFNPMAAKAKFRCDAYFIDLSRRPDLIVSDVTYWYGLFSHQRTTALWKGMISVPLASDDGDAASLLTR